MKIYIQTDIEGIAGFCFYCNSKDRTEWNRVHHERMCKLLTNEVNAAVKAAFKAGADEVLVNDNHGSGYNIFFEELDPRCEIIHGRNCSGPHWLPFLDESFDALVLIGMHAMGYTEIAIAPHSKWEVNNGKIYMGEGSMAAAIAGDMGVPTVFISGDDKVTAELSDKIDGIATAVVKQAISPYQAKSRIPVKACELIALGVLEGIQKREKIQPYKIPGPVSLQLLESENHLPPGKPVLPQAVEAETISEAFMKFEKEMKWTSFNTILPDGFTYP